MRDATIIMLATSVILFEGFICVLMFMPLYYAVVSFGFGMEAIRLRLQAHDRSKLKASIAPILVGFLAVEGLSPSTSFERQNQVTRTLIVNATPDELLANMAAPIDLPQGRHWFLSIFPLPVDIEAGSLQPGDIHKLQFIYKRWFFTNIDKGEFHLQIDQVRENYVATSVVRNTSYLSKYLNVHGTEVRFKPLSKHQTEVSLTIHYERLLDPAWYFDPMQRLAVSESADYLIDSVILRETEHDS